MLACGLDEYRDNEMKLVKRVSSRYGRKDFCYLG